MEWIDFDGERCPVDGKTMVLVRFRFNNQETARPMRADKFSWRRHWPVNSGDIIAYAVSKPA